MNEFTIASYIFLDDLLKAAEHREDPQRLVGDAIVITSLLVAGQYFGGNIEKARLYMKGHHCAQMLSKSQLNRRMHKIKGLIQDTFAFMASVFRENNSRKHFLVDSFPVAVCHNIRISRCKLLKGELFRGYNASKRVYFYGFKVAVLTTEDGLPVEIAFLPGAGHDSGFLNRMDFDLEKGSSVFGDSAFQSYEVEDTSAELDEISWEVVRKKNTTRGDIYQIALWKKQTRRIVESTFSAITSLFPRTIHAVTIDGFLLKVYMFVFAYGLHRWLEI